MIAVARASNAPKVDLSSEVGFGIAVGANRLWLLRAEVCLEGLEMKKLWLD